MEAEPPSETETDILNLMYGIDNKTTEIEISDCEILESTPSTPHSSTSEGQSEKRKRKETVSDGTIDEDLRLPTPCPLPSSFSPCVTKAIRSSNIKDRMRTALLREACSFYWEMCQKPTRDEYLTIAKTLCDKYPQLKDKKPRHGRYWESVLKYCIQRYKNIRRPPRQPSKKRKVVFSLNESSSDGSMTGDDAETSPVEADDTAEYDRSMDDLNNELSGPIQRVVVVRSLMESTFTKRRKDITMCSCCTAEIKEKYQFLKHKKWVLMEFELVCGKGIIERIERNWKKYAPKILQLQDDEDIKVNKKDLLVLQLLDNKLRTNNITATKQPPIFSVYEPSATTTSLSFDTPFSEPRLIIFSDGHIVTRNTQAFIVAEGDVLFEVDNFTVLEGLISLIASYFVFSIKYPGRSSRPATEVLLLIHEVLMEMEPDKTKKTSKYTNLINSIED